MAELKTKQNDLSVEDFIAKIAQTDRRDDCMKLVDLMRSVTKQEPRMWGGTIVGFGSYHYRYASGREGDWFLTGFSPRKQNLTIYIMSGFDDAQEQMGKLGKYTTGKCCLYIKSLADIHLPTLRKLIRESIKSVDKYCQQMQANRSTKK